MSNPIWSSVFRVAPSTSSITAYVLLRLASLSGVEDNVVETFFDKWSDRWWYGNVEQQKGLWADKVVEYVKGTPFNSLDYAGPFKKMFGS